MDIVRASPPSPAPRSNEDTDTVRREMDHRIKNHLQLLSSYARMAARRHGMTLSHLADDVAHKISAIANVHDALHRAAGGGSAPARPFLETLTATFAGSGHPISVACDPSLQLPSRQLGPIGMIVSEAVSNALTHAFAGGRAGQLWISLTRDEDRIDLRIRDNGAGIPDLDIPPNSGRGLIHMLAQQLGGYARMGSLQFGGGEVRVVFPA